MSISITTGIRRLSLHDSRLEVINRDSQKMELTFNWSTLEALPEQNISEVIIIGKTFLTLKGVRSEVFNVLNEETLNSTPFPNDFLNRLYIIGSNEIDENSQFGKISGLIRNGDLFDWFDWSFNFDTFEMSWNSHVTETEWKNGKLPDD